MVFIAAVVLLSFVLLTAVFRSPLVALKAALVPLHLWLPGTYANAPAPVAALFAVLTKVGAYAIIRLSTLAFGDAAGELAWLAAPWLMPAGMLTLTLGMFGVLAARRLAAMISFAVVASVGTLLIAVALFTPQAIAAALYYLVHDKGQSKRTVKALAVRVGLSLTLFVLLMLGYKFGFITGRLLG